MNASFRLWACVFVLAASLSLRSGWYDTALGFALLSLIEALDGVADRLRSAGRISP